MPKMDQFLGTSLGSYLKSMQPHRPQNVSGLKRFLSCQSLLQYDRGKANRLNLITHPGNVYVAFALVNLLPSGLLALQQTMSRR